MSIEAAANAFDKVLGNESSGNDNDGNVESVFDNLGKSYGDEEAGGDDEEFQAPDKKNVKEIPDEEGSEEEDPEEYDKEDEDGKEDGDEDGEEDEDPGKLDLEQVVEIKVDGAPVEVTLGEALNGYIRLETFHRRLNYLNGVNTELQTKQAEVDTNRTKYVELVSQAEGLLKEMIPEEPNWDEMFKVDPTGARNMQKQYETLQSALKGFEERRAAAKVEADKEIASKTAQYAKTEFSKFVQDNKFNDEKELGTSVQEMRKAAAAAGFSEEEIGNVYDSRMLNILLKAAKYDRLVANRPSPVNTKAKAIVSNGAGSNRTAPKGSVGKAMSRLARTGSVEDAAAVFTNVIKRK